MIAELGKSNISNVNVPLTSNKDNTQDASEVKQEKKKKKKKKKKDKQLEEDANRNSILNQIIKVGRMFTQPRKKERKINLVALE